MILHMLGGGPAQLSVIKRAKERGFKVIVSDFDKNAPGHKLSDYKSFASTFDEDAVFNDAKKYGSDFIMTTGTDQPVLTAARVSKRLNLPYFLTPDQALIVTNKKIMKRSLYKASIPTMPYVFLKENFNNDELKNLKFPLVIKPLDSQGQRGVIKVNSCNEIRDNFKILLSFSRENEILAEEFYLSNELTVSGWVDNFKTSTLIITDRVTIDNGPHLGVCVSHRYPSIHHEEENEIKKLVDNITNMIGMKNGPIYFQILTGEQGFVVNEIACRLGGAYEDEFIPVMTGVPLIDIMIDMTTGREYNKLDQNIIDNNLSGKILSLQMFFTKPGRLCRLEGMEDVIKMEGVINGRFLLKTNTIIQSRENSTQRTGYFIVVGTSKTTVNQLILKAYKKLILEDESCQTMLQFYERMLFPI